MTTQKGSDLFERIRFRGNPLANPDSVVVSSSARFTVLTPRMIRLEWSETGMFEDRGTYAFPTRYAPTPDFVTRIAGNVLTLETESLTLRYEQSSGRFTADNLSITFELDGQRQVWVPGMSNPSNLRGTRRTLDICERDAALDEGLLSRAGWALFDDSQSVLFNPDDGWVTPRPDHHVQDWVFFAYGHDYKGVLADYTCFGGPIPLIPRFVLGAWWSRYWAYSAHDLKDLLFDFATHDLPLDVLAIDMDWHTPQSWTGYTWNRKLFPDPPGFLKWVHEKGLRVTINLHPAEGVQRFEEIYPRFAEAMGENPDSGDTIPFAITDKEFVRLYFELLHHPMEDDGVDFCWMDWQQGETSEMKGLDPLLWINHLHFQDSTRRGKRPMLYSRWGGLGNHRYHIGFSGDTIVGWPALRFQPYFTATASNVCYGWWSHDIGGHMGGATEPELYIRWVQFGMLSPCLRLHATKDPHAERRPWKYPDTVLQAAKAAFHWRYQLLPYIYTMARVASDTGISLCRPMYYEYPKEDAAYVARYQYFFGDEMIAAPIVHPADPETGMAATDVWIPEGTWIDHTTKETFTGPRWVRLVGDLNRVPMLMKEGAILPLSAPFKAMPPTHLASGTMDAIPRDSLVLSIFPGAEGMFRLYEDDGFTEAYKEGQVEWTEIRTRIEGEHTWVVHIAPVEGRCDVLPSRRRIEIRLQGSQCPREIMLDGVETLDWTYDAETLTAIIHMPMRDKRQPTTIIAAAEGQISALGEAHNREVILSDIKRLLGDSYPEGAEEPDALLDATLRLDAPGRPDAIARLGGPFTRFIEFVAPEEASQQFGRVIVGSPAHADEPYDLEVTFALFRTGKPERQTIRLKGATKPHIIDAPFAFDGQVQAMYWEAEAKIAWRGRTLVTRHRSEHMFPTVYAWSVLVYNREEKPIALKQVMDDKGHINDVLNWETHIQKGEELRNLNQPHFIFFRKHQERRKAGEPLACYMTTTVLSPDERDAIILFRSGGPTVFYLNGRKVKGASVHEAEKTYPFPNDPGLRQVRKTTIVHLRAGESTLLVHTRPLKTKLHSWYFGGAFIEPDGNLMTDLAFRLARTSHRLSKRNAGMFQDRPFD